MEKIKIAIADDHEVVLDSLSLILSSENEFEVILKAVNGIELLQKIQEHNLVPNVILMDINMPEMDGFQATEKVSKLLPNAKIIYLTANAGAPFIIKAIESHAHGYFLKSLSFETLVNAIKEVYENGYYFHGDFTYEKYTQLMNGRARTTSTINFTMKELEIIKLLCEEKTDFEISQLVDLTELSVQTYRKRLMKKVKAKKTIGIVVYAIKNQIF